jgi:hypothetical protein
MRRFERIQRERVVSAIDIGSIGGLPPWSLVNARRRYQSIDLDRGWRWVPSSLQPSDASVDPIEARSVAGSGPDDCAVPCGGNRAGRPSEVRPWDGSDRGPPFRCGDFLGLTTADGLNPCCRGYQPCAIGYATRGSSRRGPHIHSIYVLGAIGGRAFPHRSHAVGGRNGGAVRPPHRPRCRARRPGSHH